MTPLEAMTFLYELKEKVTRWVDWANKADPSEYDLFCMEKEAQP